MSTTEEQGTRSREREEQEGSSERQQRRADSDHRRRPDEEEDPKQEQKEQDEPEQEERDEQKKKEEDDSGPKRPELWKKVAGSLPLIVGIIFLVSFFVWVCLQMAGQTVGGPKLLVGIFGGAVLGIAAAGAGVGIARLADRED
jgi:hypothetical protein